MIIPSPLYVLRSFRALKSLLRRVSGCSKAIIAQSTSPRLDTSQNRHHMGHGVLRGAELMFLWRPSSAFWVVEHDMTTQVAPPVTETSLVLALAPGKQTAGRGSAASCSIQQADCRAKGYMVVSVWI